MLEYSRLCRKRNTDPGILNRQVESDLCVLALPHAECKNDASLLGKFDSVVKQIGNHLAQAQGITTHTKGVAGRQFGDQFQDLVAQVQSFLTDFGNLATIGGGALAAAPRRGALL